MAESKTQTVPKRTGTSGAAGSKKTDAGKRASSKKTLVIVESPAKAKTIEHYLGRGYMVKASMGHLIDLPKSRLAIDTEHGFEPEYITVRGKSKLLKELQRDAKGAKSILLASDNDREGEAIAWHLNNALKGKTTSPIARIVFNEITPDAIKEAVKNPRAIDEAKVNAQKARRVLDRLVGYNLSPLLWKKVKNGLSAGRVQSVALKLICDREKEVEDFIPQEYWSLDATFLADKDKGKAKITAELVQYNGQKPELKSEADVKRIIDEVRGDQAVVSDVKETERSVKAKPPFTTSTMQQTAANRLGFTSKKTMQVAQRLYEGVQLGSQRVGLITYMRTDSTRISAQAIADVRSWIEGHYPDALPERRVDWAVGKGAQDAHEAIRPTSVDRDPESMRQWLTRDELRLYAIIWERFVSSQMNSARMKTTAAEIKVGEAVFRASASSLSYKGFYHVLKLLAPKEDVSRLPPLAVGQTLEVEGFDPQQHFTQGPARYTDASMVKALEEKGIGRPSTYAPIISVLQDRYYVTRNNRQLVPTALGKIICKILCDSFPDVINEKFTSDIESDLDRVEQDELVWNDMIGGFFAPFKRKVEDVMETAASIKGTLDEPTDEICELCGRPMVKKLGKFGYFLACTGFPECRNTKSVPLAPCPRKGCGGQIVARKAKKRGREFYGCTNYPECSFITHFKPTNSFCPSCGWFLVEKWDKRNGSYKCCINPDCDFLHSIDQEVDAPAEGSEAAAV